MQAIKEAGYDGPTEAWRDNERALGISKDLVISNSNGNRAISRRAAERYAKVFGHTPGWYLYGSEEGKLGPAFPSPLPDVGNFDTVQSTVPVMGYLGAGAEVEPDYEQVPPEGLFEVSLPFPLPEEMIAFEVRGDSMRPVYRDGHVIIVYREQRKPLEAFYGHEAAVRTSEGRRFIKTITKGRGNTVTLNSWNADPLEGQRLDWIGEIFATLPPSAVRHLGRRARREERVAG